MSGDRDSLRYKLDDLTLRIAALSPAKRALFELELHKRRLRPHDQATIRRRAKHDGLPLSFAQRRLWFLSELEPKSPTYNESRAIRLRGSLDVEAIKKSLNQIVARHEVLRTTFVAVDGNPVQVIADSRPVELSLIDLQPRKGIDRDSEARRLMAETIRRPFDLSRDLLLRVLLLRLADQEHLLLVVTHHIVSDAWSTTILLQELALLYGGFTSGRASALPKLPIQYVDYALWQREALTGEVLEKQLSYWRNRLENMSALQLDTDRPRPVVQSHRGAAQSLVFSKDTADQLRALSRKENVTLFITLLAAFQTLLHRYTGQDDIVVGAPIAGRTHSESERLIGFFVNTLVLRTDLSGNPTFRAALARVREVALGAYAHQDVPFETVVEELQPERNLSQSPLFQVMFVLQNAPNTALEFEGLRVSPAGFDSLTAKFDLTLSMHEEAQGLKGSLEYSTDLFDAVTIERMLIHFQMLLQGIVADPDRRLSELPLLTDIERHQFLVEWNDTKSDYPKNKCIHQLFEEQVQRTPEAVAVIGEDQQLTYRQLNTRANQLAHYLRKLGVGPEILVGICMIRSVEMIVGLLGVLKAGGAYVPLDPEYPEARLASMLEDMQAPVLLTKKKFWGALSRTISLKKSGQRMQNLKSKIQNPTLVCLDTDWQFIGQESPENLDTETMEQNIAYVIYTSGSTGKPKGVAVLHRAVSRLLVATNYVELKPDDVMAQASDALFDAATFEIWGALLHGARLLILPKEVVLSPQAFGSAIQTYRITVLFLTTALFNHLVREIPLALAKLSYLLFGGEAVDAPRVRELFRHGRPKRLLHVYGPTEATTFASSHSVENVAQKATTISIGRPIANTQIYLLDNHLQPVPVGVRGELYIGGDALARGYLNQPELTAEKFIPNPFIEEAGTRLYKTGDLARYLPDGNIEFLGRIDDQVKIRGYRIEPGEVEGVLREYPGTHQAIVVVREDTPGEKQLVAYVVSNRGQLPSASELRNFLSTKLPDYMLPSAFVFLNKLPLTRTGKVDHQALPPAANIQSEPENNFIAPRDSVERRLAQIYAKVLGVQKIGVKDDFFDLGGHSLLVGKVMSQIEKTFRKTLPIAALFQAPIVEELASLLREEKTATRWSSLIPIQTNGSRLPFFWVHGEASDAFLPQYLGPDQPIYGLKHQSENGYPALYTTVESIAAHYVDEIRTVQPHGPYYLGGYCFGGMVAFEMAQQLKKQGQEVALLVLLEPSTPAISVSAHTAGPRSNGSSIRNDIRRHLRNLAVLTAKDKFTYLLQKSSGKISDTAVKILRPVTRMLQPVIWNVYPRFGCRIPRSLRSPYILKVYNKTMKTYIPKVYIGRVIVFTSKGNLHAPQQWEKLAVEGLDVHEIPGNHVNVLNEPHVGVWAEKLKHSLTRAQDVRAK